MLNIKKQSKNVPINLNSSVESTINLSNLNISSLQIKHKYITNMLKSNDYANLAKKYINMVK